LLSLVDLYFYSKREWRGCALQEDRPPREGVHCTLYAQKERFRNGGLSL
jgi:hypothetical protein